MQAIILAGGKGRRLHPYTTVLPKPMMPIGDYPIIEVILRQLAHFSFTEVIISTGYLESIIRAYLQSCEFESLKITFSHETTPLSTMGPLHLIDNLQDTFLVINGDILTDLNFSYLLQEHLDKKVIATVATYQRDSYIDFGVLYTNKNGFINKFQEKPVYHFDVSMGIYVFQKEILNEIPKGEPYGFDQLMLSLIEKKQPIYSYPHDGFWLDIGRPDDYERAISDFEEKREIFNI
jgi:NDP-sugar pyrophosphorylase family protein